VEHRRVHRKHAGPADQTHATLVEPGRTTEEHFEVAERGQIDKGE
jgi:hypothetical protein